MPSSHELEFENGTSVESEVVSAAWRIEKILGIGGTATVFLATGLHGQRSALKVMRPEAAQQQGALQRFLREGRLARHIEHAGMVRCLGEGTTSDSRPYLALEYLEGCTLEALVRSGDHLSLLPLLRLFVDVLDLMAHCHSRGIVHRDLKPSNLFVTRTGMVKVLDFGVATAQGVVTDYVREGVAIGTPSFMAPEQAMGDWEHVDARADVFSLGATLYSLLSGKRLHVGKNEAESFTLAATRSAPSLGEVAPELPTEIVSFVDRALQWDKRSRFADAACMKAQLEGILLGFEEVDTKTTKPWQRQEDIAPKAIVDVPQDALCCSKAFSLLPRALEQWEQGLDHDATLKEAADYLVRVSQAGGSDWRLTVRPWSILLRDETVWSPHWPWLPVIQQMFDDGIRFMACEPTLAGAERLFRRIFDQVVVESRRADLVAEFWPLSHQGVRIGVAWGLLGTTASRVNEACESQTTVLRLMEASGEDIDRLEFLETWPCVSELLLDDHTRSPWLSPTDDHYDALFSRYLVAMLEEMAKGRVLISRDESILRTLARDLLEEEQTDTLLFASLSLAPSETRLDVLTALWLPEALPRLLKHLNRRVPAEALEDRRLSNLRKLLDIFDTRAASICLRVLPELTHPTLARIVVQYVVSHLPEQMEGIADVLFRLTGETGYRLIKALGEQKHDEVRVVLERLEQTTSPLRIAAKAMLYGIEREEGSVISQLAAPGWPARAVALWMVKEHRLESAEPWLVRTIEDPSFHHRSRQERRLVFEALVALSLQQAEQRAEALVRRHGLIREDAVDDTRCLAVELLGEISSNEAILSTLRGAESPMWWNPRAIRVAARTARQRVEQRLGIDRKKSVAEARSSTLPPEQVPGSSTSGESTKTSPNLSLRHVPLPRNDEAWPNEQVARFFVSLACLVELVQRQADEDSLQLEALTTVDAVRQQAQRSGKLHVTMEAGVPYVDKKPVLLAAWVAQQIEPLVGALQWLEWLDIRIDPRLTPDDAIAFATAIATESSLESVRYVHVGKSNLQDLSDVIILDPHTSSNELKSTYATILAALWEARSAWAREQIPDLDGMLRVSQMVVDLAMTRRVAITGAKLGGDVGARWLDAALLAVEMVSLLESDPEQLRDVALAGLLLSVIPFDERGAVIKEGTTSWLRAGRLGDPSHLAQKTFSILMGISGIHGVIRRAITLASEAQARRYRRLSVGASSASVWPAVALATSIRYVESLSRQVPGDDALVEMLREESMDTTDEVCVRLLYSALGEVPRGAVVELASREVGVLRTPLRAWSEQVPIVAMAADELSREIPEFSRLEERPLASRSSLRAVLSLWKGEQLPQARPRRGKWGHKKRGDVRESKDRSKRPQAPLVSTLGNDILEDFGLPTLGQPVPPSISDRLHSSAATLAPCGEETLKGVKMTDDLLGAEDDG
ncbi:MAG TPA: serine/threonine-protein kinase [Polyangiaceae bacterium]|jgi:serine/threonine protein kinase|nr:MAG: Serine/threonine-protein kinase PknB [Deltaproteobacteria bacterium ADurb.Bin207]HNS95373.1 serine/threonine-protein kinase [Polyangiaceae bacterium]HNZ23209.1 serine/threonine-protein kinase [Polyangiaceae bacterium]HOD24475.1 serine/threonine-protein kinase [Polyangiaceae bacterium]HOE49755.1 serine/threonine-protein kinase [Polyangiaceae bacterium]